MILPRPLGLLRGVGDRRFVGGAAGAAAGYLALLFFTGKLATTVIPAGRPYPEVADTRN